MCRSYGTLYSHPRVCVTMCDVAERQVGLHVQEVFLSAIGDRGAKEGVPSAAHLQCKERDVA